MNGATIGSGRIVTYFLMGAHNDPRLHLSAVYSRTQERADEFATVAQSITKQQDKPKTYTSLQALAEDPSIDWVYIASPNHLHAQQTIMMLEHGKHVLCEKPFASNLQEGLAMLSAARASRTPKGAPVVLMEAMMTTMMPNFAQVRAALPRLGAIRRYFAQFCQYSSRYDDYKERGIVPNVFTRECSGGSLRDLGVYGLAPLVHLFGMPACGEALPSLVQTMSWNLPTGVDGMGSFFIQYPSMQAVIVHAKISESSLPSEIQGENGRIIIEKLSTMVRPQLILRDGTVEDLSVPTVREGMTYEFKEFLNVIERGGFQSEENTWERSLDVLRLIDLAN